MGIGRNSFLRLSGSQEDPWSTPKIMLVRGATLVLQQRSYLQGIGEIHGNVTAEQDSKIFPFIWWKGAPYSSESNAGGSLHIFVHGFEKTNYSQIVVHGELYMRENQDVSTSGVSVLMTNHWAALAGDASLRSPSFILFDSLRGSNVTKVVKTFTFYHSDVLEQPKLSNPICHYIPPRSKFESVDCISPTSRHDLSYLLTSAGISDDCPSCTASAFHSILPPLIKYFDVQELLCVQEEEDASMVIVFVIQDGLTLIAVLATCPNDCTDEEHGYCDTSSLKPAYATLASFQDYKRTAHYICYVAQDWKNHAQGSERATTKRETALACQGEQERIVPSQCAKEGPTNVPITGFAFGMSKATRRFVIVMKGGVERIVLSLNVLNVAVCVNTGNPECHGHGRCIARERNLTPQCECRKGWLPPDCRLEKPEHFSHRKKRYAVQKMERENVQDEGGAIFNSRLHNVNDTPCAGEPECAGHGQCINGTCHCNEDWRGLDCSIIAHQGECANNCSSNGVCKPSSSSGGENLLPVCHCFEGWAGTDCSRSEANQEEEDFMEEHPWALPVIVVSIVGLLLLGATAVGSFVVYRQREAIKLTSRRGSVNF
ncbi:Teneurin-a [Balamuthia mandrillaris]